MGLVAILINGPRPFKKNQYPFNRRLHMEFEENGPRGFRGGRSKMSTDGRRTASDHNGSS